MIQVEGLVKTFKDVPAVDDVSFTVKEGEIFAFLGPNGAGKSTTVQMLTTLVRPTSGAARVNGFDVVKQEKDVRLSIGVALQETFLLGLTIPVGAARFFFTVLLAIGFGLGFAGYSVGVALKTRNAQAAQARTLLFFPLIFLSTTFVPKELIEAEWLKVAATFNPTTYIFEGMRAVLTQPRVR
ncbi:MULTISPECIES: ATP-binding cassette domain-containing protein [Exiguobacterium]|uniref:ATP-binding cassette domain-containing protein n=1 Tax=Exiguobacterium TaxID=33986 RepID=UPI0025C4A08F|nr:MULTISPECIES: ATP-binding cassette domain-containing protein [Exiguobacterium]